MYRSILVGTDCTDTAAVAVEHAAELAQAVGATLHVVSVYREPATVAMAHAGYGSGPFEPWTAAAYEDRERQVASVTTRLRDRGLNVIGHVERGEPAAAIVSVAHEIDADLIVVGSRGMNGLRRLVGSVPNALAHAKGFHVLVVRTD
jgi:nucleotide-binding universal stress UspA family protein